MSQARVKIVALSAVYFGAFAWVYIAYLPATFGELGFGYNENWPLYDIVTVAFLALLPAFWIPTRFERVSALLIYIQYFLIYIPAIWMTRHSVLPILGTADQALLSITLLGCMAILLWMHHRVPLLTLTPLRLREAVFWNSIFALSAFLLLTLAVELGGNFRLVTLDKIYSLRDSASDLLESSGNVVARYAFLWLNAFLLPFIWARGFARSNWLLLLGVFASYVFLYGIWGSKASLFSPVILIGASLWASRPAQQKPRLMIEAFVFALTVPLFLPFNEGIGYLIKIAWLSIVDMRTFAIPGSLLIQYFDFFRSHPLTYGSHIAGLNWFIHYPYDYDVPRTIGYYFNGDLVTANASYWAQDGLASFGPIGMLLVTFFVSVVLWLLDSATKGLQTKFVLTATTGIVLIFANGSIFTTLISGGLMPFMAACILMPRPRPRPRLSDMSPP